MMMTAVSGVPCLSRQCQPCIGGPRGECVALVAFWLVLLACQGHAPPTPPLLCRVGPVSPGQVPAWPVCQYSDARLAGGWEARGAEPASIPSLSLSLQTPRRLRQEHSTCARTDINRSIHMRRVLVLVHLPRRLLPSRQLEDGLQLTRQYLPSAHAYLICESGTPRLT